MKPDIQIAQEIKLLPIEKIAKKLKINKKSLQQYGPHIAKIDPREFEKRVSKGKLILVTAINPTRFGEGKTTTTIGLAQGLKKIKKKVVVALREPSLGPVFGLKGGATGGGYSQVAPMENINLHFTGDIHAITTVNNLIAAAIDNHIFQGNLLRFDLEKIFWRRCIDLNDRALREIEIGLGDKNHSSRKDYFNISVASEIMAIFCLSENLDDFGVKVDQCIIGLNQDGQIIKVKDLGITGSLKALLFDAIKPNLVQTLEGVPALIHGGPFANIAHGCNSIIATKLGLKLGDYLVTEAGFGADLGAQKFFDIKCRFGKLNPDLVVIVATLRALRLNGGSQEPEYNDIDAVRQGIVNLQKHIENIQKYNLPYVVTLNRFENDSSEEIEYLKNWCQYNNHSFEINEGFLKGGNGAINLAKLVIDKLNKENQKSFKLLYDLDLPIKDKIKKIAKEIYGARGVKYSLKAEEDIKWIEENKYNDLAICMAKTPMSLSDNPQLLGAPKGFYLNINEVRISSGAGFVIPIAGSILTMPGLPKEPAATKIDVVDGKIKGLY